MFDIAQILAYLVLNISRSQLYLGFGHFGWLPFFQSITFWGANGWYIEAETNGSHFAGDIFKCIFLNENVWIRIKISLKFVPKGPINNIPAMVQIMAWRRPGDKPFSEPMMVSSPTHICVTRPQWIKLYFLCWSYSLSSAGHISAA